MRKPEGYDGAEAREGGFAQPKAGPHVLGIVQTSVEIKNGEQRLVLMLDIADGKFKNFYTLQTRRFNKNRYLRSYQNTEGKGLPYFKGVVGAIEESNAGYKFEFDEKTLVGKKVGGVLREEEFMMRDGTVITNLHVFFLCSIKSVLDGEHKVPAIKKLPPPATDGYQGGPAGGYPDGTSPDDFDQSIPEMPEAPEGF